MFFLTLISSPAVSCSTKRSNCYMVWAGESSSPGQGRNNNGLEIGCLVDVTSGLLTFTANGKELSTYYQVKVQWRPPDLFLSGNLHFIQPTPLRTKCLEGCFLKSTFYCLLKHKHVICPAPYMLSNNM